jgi:hypothetical protein
MSFTFYSNNVLKNLPMLAFEMDLQISFPSVRPQDVTPPLAFPGKTRSRMSSRLSARRASATRQVLLVLVLALFPPPSAGHLSSDDFSASSADPSASREDEPNAGVFASATIGGGLHEDATMACAGCAVVAHQLKRLMGRPPANRAGSTVRETHPETGEESEVPYFSSRVFEEAALRRTCDPVSLNGFSRTKTWLGDTTWRPDSLPWVPEHAKPVDEDLRKICRRATRGAFGEALLSAVAAEGDGLSACRRLGCGSSAQSLHATALETTARLFGDVSLVLKLAPVFLMAFALPALFRPMASPPRPPNPDDLAAELAEVRARRAGVNTRGGGDAGDERGARRRNQGGNEERGKK